MLAALEVPTLLVANDFGSDEAGRRVGHWLQQHGVGATAVASTDYATRRVVVVSDGDHTRTWFAYLPGVADALERVDLSSIATASFVYLDAYQLIEAAAIRVIRTVRAHGQRLFVNLGGIPLSDALRHELAGYSNLLIQTNIDDDDHVEAPSVARRLLEWTCADWVIVTTGRYGALAASHSQLLTTSAVPVEVRHTHCAGAAFSGGLLYGLHAGMPMRRSLMLASASGALRCVRDQSAPLPSLHDLESLVTLLARPASN
ncbi:carbohydrate kinase family protein [Nocardia panacis]|uniref:carbohydrate kinase family protein n=1 Tax=Nocardia panacis TaxID=2340916 RepID=UPI00193AD159|nr:PfkB family carbohydrate kinase [Nocardia panacis]